MTNQKHESELDYWNNQYSNNKFNNSWYEYFYTVPFGLTVSDFIGKNILDIGCGPLGSLEWVSDKAQCFGLDPLAEEYLNQFDCRLHKMNYMKGNSEKIPFDNEYFDYVTSFNSLDHVDNVQQTLTEISRVLKPQGYFLLIVEMNHESRPCEPHTISEYILDWISTNTQLQNLRTDLFGIQFRDNLFKNVREQVLPNNIPEILVAKFTK